MKTFSSREIAFLHGIRSLAIIWVVIGHTYGLFRLIPLMNGNDIFLFIKQISAMFMFGGYMAVDTFFLLSAMLLTLSILHELDKT